MKRALLVLICSSIWLGVGITVIGCNHTKSSSEATEQSNGICPATPQELTGTSADGAQCLTYVECAPVCCECPNDASTTYLLARCDVGKCDSSQDACAGTDTPALCP